MPASTNTLGGERVALGPRPVIEVHQKGNPLVRLIAHLEGPHHVRHEAVKDHQATGLIRSAGAVFFGFGMYAVLFEKSVHVVGKIPPFPNIEIAAMLIGVLGSSLHRNNTGISPRLIIKNTFWIGQKTFSVNMYII